MSQMVSVDAPESALPRLNNGLFTSATDEWATPAEFFAMLDTEFGFTLDVCATEANAKCARFFSRADDGLTQPWAPEVCWMNPPYGRVIGQWVEKAHRESLNGATVVCLIPARTDTAYWHDHAMKASEIRLVRGRLHFDGHKSKGHNAPFPCAVVVFRPAATNAIRLTAIGRSENEEVA